MKQQVLTGKAPQTYKQMRSFERKIFLHQHDFFLDNSRGHDYEMLLAPLAEKNFMRATTRQFIAVSKFGEVFKKSARLTV
jgi:hypothetical protein